MSEPSIVDWVRFPGGRSSKAVRHVGPGQTDEALAALGLKRPVSVIAVNGGTDVLPPELVGGIAEAMAAVVDVAIVRGATIVTGGTDAGVFRILGAQVAAIGAEVDLVGVAPVGRVALPGEVVPTDSAGLEPHHTGFVLTQGDRWGDETSTMLALVAALAGGRPTVAVIAGGGRGTSAELEGHVRAGRPVVLLRGSGGVADSAEATTALTSVVEVAAGVDLIRAAILAALDG